MSPCALYLVATPEFVAARDHENLRKIIEIWKPSALRLATTDALEARHAVEQIGDFVQDLGTALILTNLPKLAQGLNCDGVHFTHLPSNSPNLRSEVMSDLQIGVTCPASRDEMMRAGELGADYISISANIKESGSEDPHLLAQWWSQIMELPLIAEDITDSAQARGMVDAGVDFISIPVRFHDTPSADEHLRRVYATLGGERLG